MWQTITVLALVACGGPRPEAAKPVTAPVETTLRLHRGTPAQVGGIEATFASCTVERYTTSPDGPEKHGVDCEIQLVAGPRRESWRFLLEAPLEHAIAQRPAALERDFEGVRLRITGLQVDREPMHLDLVYR